ncbi:MAG: phage tail tape measure protein, partial [Dorea sp.]|nr:phage tail tape measure protein [Dorea sp.]
MQEIDKSIVDLQMATGDSYTNVRKLVSGYNDFAKQLGATTTEVSMGASDWLRQGKSIADTNKLVQDSMVLSKVANISSEDSTSYLTAMMKGYKKSVEEVAEINDSLTSIDLAAAVDAGGLAEATSRVAASADLAGISLNKLLGYEAAVGEASQESMSVIGNSFKTIFSRMSDIKAGNLELIDEDGTTATLSDVETVLNNIDVQLRSSTNEFHDFDDVLDDTAKRWDKLSSVQQAAVSKAFAGQRQANRFKLLMENYDTALEYEKIANQSSGTAMQKFNDAYLNSIEAKQKSLQASFESLSVNLFNRDSISGILEATQALVEFLDKTNLLKGALSGLAVGGALKGFVALTTSITQAAMKMQNFQQAMSLLKIGDISTDGIEKLSVLMDGLSQSQLKAVISSEQLSTAQRLSILTAMGMSDAQASATLSTMGLSTAEGAATASTLSLGSAFKGLWSTLLANPIVLISTALTAGIAIWSSYKQSIEESIQKATDASTAWRESTNTLNDQIAKYKELKAQLDSGTLTPAEEFDTRQQILDIQTQITSEYGNQVSGIDLVNGSLRTQLGLLQQISSENARSTLNENRKEYKEAFDEMTKEQAYNLGSIEIDDKSEVNKDIRNIVDSFEDAGLSLTKSGGGGALLSVLFKGDATQAEATIDSFMNKIDTLKTKYNDKNSIHVLDSILDQASVSLSDNKKILEDYQENYKTFLQMDMLSKGLDKGSVADIFNKYTESVQKYNEALSSENKDHINKARTDFSFLSEEVNNLLSKGDNSKFSTLFDDVTDQLNKASIKAFDFQEALSGEAGSKNQFHKVSEDIKSVSDHLKELKLDSIDALDALLTEGNQVGESELWTLAEAWGLSAESSKDDLQSFIDILYQAASAAASPKYVKLHFFLKIFIFHKIIVA